MTDCPVKVIRVYNIDGVGHVIDTYNVVVLSGYMNNLCWVFRPTVRLRQRVLNDL
jgi:hypothetical protein